MLVLLIARLTVLELLRRRLFLVLIGLTLIVVALTSWGIAQVTTVGGRPMTRVEQVTVVSQLLILVGFMFSFVLRGVRGRAVALRGPRVGDGAGDPRAPDLARRVRHRKVARRHRDDPHLRAADDRAAALPRRPHRAVRPATSVRVRRLHGHRRHRGPHAGPRALDTTRRHGRRRRRADPLGRRVDRRDRRRRRPRAEQRDRDAHRHRHAAHPADRRHVAWRGVGA